MSTNLLPALDSATEAALRASIKRFGVLVPVVVDQETSEVVDGHNRVRIATEEGKPCPELLMELPEAPDDRAALLASLNDDRRQRMSIEQRREVVEALRADGHSTRAIASAVGVSQPTVMDDIAAAGDRSLSPATSESQSPDLVTGQDGKTYPAKQHGNNKLTAKQQDEIVHRRRRGETTKALAAEFGVSSGAISRIAIKSNGGAHNNRKGSDRKTLEGMASTASALQAALADLDLERVLESQDTADVTRWMRVLNGCRLALKPVVEGLNGGKLPK
jgi:ParB-like chromosome segregation protein Spo0J